MAGRAKDDRPTGLTIVHQTDSTIPTNGPLLAGTKPTPRVPGADESESFPMELSLPKSGPFVGIVGIGLMNDG
ncbi:hypothetical protein D3H35_09875 [Cohnella faecalis]|uniref:Uncharacterized protein n=1 Tax=Cohnella faecalis TaxID=2315694 RepID=A0A398CNM9_9BACL|nr:hypothetical protein D3H35_09875 [Cohnella faecalis]